MPKKQVVSGSWKLPKVKVPKREGKKPAYKKVATVKRARKPSVRSRP